MCEKTTSPHRARALLVGITDVCVLLFSFAFSRAGGAALRGALGAAAAFGAAFGAVGGGAVLCTLPFPPLPLLSFPLD